MSKIVAALATSICAIHNSHFPRALSLFTVQFYIRQCALGAGHLATKLLIGNQVELFLERFLQLF